MRRTGQEPASVVERGSEGDAVAAGSRDVLEEPADDASCVLVELDVVAPTKNVRSVTRATVSSGRTSPHSRVTSSRTTPSSELRQHRATDSEDTDSPTRTAPTPVPTTC